MEIFGEGGQATDSVLSTKVQSKLNFHYFSIQISKHVEVAKDRTTYTLGEEVFIINKSIHEVYLEALNYTTYKFSNISSALKPFKVEVSDNGQYYWLNWLKPPDEETCCMLLKELAKQNRVRTYLSSNYKLQQ